MVSQKCFKRPTVDPLESKRPQKPLSRSREQCHAPTCQCFTRLFALLRQNSHTVFRRSRPHSDRERSNRPVEFWLYVGRAGVTLPGRVDGGQSREGSDESSGRYRRAHFCSWLSCSFKNHVGVPRSTKRVHWTHWILGFQHGRIQLLGAIVVSKFCRERQRGKT